MSMMGEAYLILKADEDALGARVWREMGEVDAPYGEKAVREVVGRHGTGEYLVLRGYQRERFTVTQRTEYDVERAQQPEDVTEDMTEDVTA